MCKVKTYNELNSKQVLLISNWLQSHLKRNVFLNIGQSQPLFRLLSSFSHHKSITNWKSVDGVLGIQTRGRKMVGTDETTELWQQPKKYWFLVRHFKTTLVAEAPHSSHMISIAIHLVRAPCPITLKPDTICIRVSFIYKWEDAGLADRSKCSAWWGWIC